MLHKINLPHSWLYLNWIVAVQYRLLAHLCQPAITPDKVTVDWVIALFPKLDRAWLISFCSRSHEQNTLLVRMKIIAGFDDAVKAQVLADFTNDVQLKTAFQLDRQTPFKFKSLSGIRDNMAREAVRRFFDSFYAPSFYKDDRNSRLGYYIPRRNNDTYHFHHAEFVSKFTASNNKLLVCAFCDGALSGVQVDHFYPRKHHPFLSCHPLNLVPICGECNKAKRETVPLDPTPNCADPMRDWFHPYLQPLVDSFEIRFVRDDRPLHPILVGQDERTNKRLKNFVGLVNLKPRWEKALKDRIQHTKNKIDSFRSHKRRKKQDDRINRQELIDKLDMWADELTIGDEVYGLVGKAYLAKAVAQDPDMFDELWIYTAGDNAVDPITVN